MNESELTQRNEELELIHTLTSAVSSSMELEDLLEAMFERVLSLFSAGAAEIFLVEEASGALQMRFRIGDLSAIWEKNRFRRAEGFLGQVAAASAALVSPASGKGWLVIAGCEEWVRNNCRPSVVCAR